MEDNSKIVKYTLKSNQENQTINNISNMQLTA
jgi:hypothetical protein